MKWLLLLLVIATIPLVYAPNDPGHDSLYIEENGDSELTGNLNISDELRWANLLWTSQLQIMGNGTIPSTGNAEIYTSSSGNELTINPKSTLYIARDTGTLVSIDAFVNITGSNDINLVSGDLSFGGVERISNAGVGAFAAGSTVDGSSICTSSNGLCGGSGGDYSYWRLDTDSGSVLQVTNNTLVNITGGTGITTSRSGSTVSVTNDLGDSIESGEVTSLDWTKLDSYPSGCGAGEAVQVINDTLTCISVGSGGGGWTNSSTQVYLVDPTDDLNVSNTLLVDSSEGYVGIGTNSPSNDFHVYSDVQGETPVLIQGNGRTAPIMEIKATGVNIPQGLFISGESATGGYDAIAVYSDLAKTEKTFGVDWHTGNIFTDGNLGLSGITTTSAPIHIGETSSGEMTRWESGNKDMYMGFDENTREWSFGYDYALSNQDAIVISESLDLTGPYRLSVMSGGYVGVNTRYPTQALEVNGSINVSGGSRNIWVDGSRVCTEGNGLCSSGASNPFDQSLNTTDSVAFDNMTLTGTLDIDAGSGTGSASDKINIIAYSSGGLTQTHSIYNNWNNGGGRHELTFENEGSVIASFYSGEAIFRSDVRALNSGTLNGAGLMAETPSATNPTVLPNQGDEDTGIGWDGEDQVSVVAGGNEILRISDDVGDEAMLINPVASTDIGLAVRGAASQTENLTEWQDNSGSALASVNASGAIFSQGSEVCTEGNGLCSGGNSSWNESYADTKYLLNTGDTATGNYTFDTDTLHIDSTNNRIGIGTTSPSRELQIDGKMAFSNSGMTFYESGNIFYFRNEGGFTDLQIIANALRATIKPNYGLDIQNQGVNDVALIVKSGTSSQTANITEWQDSSGNRLASVNASGAIFSQGSEVCTEGNGLCGDGNSGYTQWRADSDTNSPFDVSNNTLVQFIGGTSIDTSHSGTDITFDVADDSIDGSELADTITLDTAMNIVGTSSTDFSVNNSNLYVDLSENLVGIGTNTPATPLHINESTNTIIRLTASKNYNIGTGLSLFGGNSFAIYELSNTGAPFIITDVGLVGVGDITPDAHLEVSAEGGSGGKIFMLSSDDSGDGDLLTVTEEGKVGIGLTSPTQFLDVNGSINITGGSRDIWVDGSRVCTTDNGLCAQPLSSAAGWTNSSTEVYLTNSASNITTHQGASAPTLFIDNTNNRTGIGTANPSYLFSVEGSQDQTDPHVLIAGEGTEVTALNLLNRADSANRFVSIEFSHFSEQARARIRSLAQGTEASSGSKLFFDTASDNAGTFNDNQLVLSNDGNVGIGDSTPNERLEVAGNINSTGGNICITGGNCLSNMASVAGSDTQIQFNDGGNFGADANFTWDATNDRLGIGDGSPSQKLHVFGNINVSGPGNIYYEGDLTGYGADLAELVHSVGRLEPGDVVVLDEDADEGVRMSDRPYDTAVAGIISTDPSHLMSADEGDVPLALAGRVPVKVSAENGAIKRGDLLTTSSTPGHAMRCSTRTECTGSILGKAMQSLNEGTGVITALVVLG